MKISRRPLPFQGTKSDFEVTRKHSRVPICECDTSHAQVDLRKCGCVRVPSDALNDKTHMYLYSFHLFHFKCLQWMTLQQSLIFKEPSVYGKR